MPDKVDSVVKAALTNDLLGNIRLREQYFGMKTIHVDVDTAGLKPEGYRLTIDSSVINLIGYDKPGVFHGKQTLLQLLDYAMTEKVSLPCVDIVDWPAFQRRGFMLDVSRDKVPTMESLFTLIDMLARWKINELQLYVEHTFAYSKHPLVWKDASPLTADEIKVLDKYCADRFIDLVPNQNSFGHMENWLKHDEYAYLAECPTDCNTKWGMLNRRSLDPTNPASFQLVKGLYDELLPNFTSQYFNIGCDETVELGNGRSRAECQKEGTGRVYLDFVLKLDKEVQAHGRKTMFWGDIIVSHPELIPELPKNMTALVWGYEGDYPFDKQLPTFKAAGLDFYVCPGTSSWRSLVGKNHNAFENLKNAALEGMKNGAKGYLLTDWGDNGHWQPFPVSYPALVVGSSYAWNYDSTALGKLEFQLNHYLFNDPAGLTAKALLKLGDAYRAAGIPEGNANVFHLLLSRYKWTLQGNYQSKKITIAGLKRTEKEVNDALDILAKARPGVADSATLKAELGLAARLSLHALHLGIARLAAKDMATENIPLAERNALAAELAPLIDAHRKLWMARNRPGGLDDSTAKLQELVDYYGKK